MGDHAHDLVAAYLRLEAAAHSAIRAGGEHRSFRLTDLDHGLFDERRGRARLDAGTAGDALGVNEFLVDARRDLGLESNLIADDVTQRGAYLFGDAFS